MARAPRRHLTRNAVVFLGALAAHVWLFHAAATQVFAPLAPVEAAQAIETPIAAYPRLRPIRLDLAQARRRRVRASAPPRVPEAASVTPLATNLDGPLAEPLAAPQLASSGETSDAGAAPPDLTDRTPPPPHYPINPGYWRVVEHWPLISRTELYCVEPWNIVRFMAEPCNHIYRCAYPVQTIGADTLRFQGVISGRNDRFDVRGGGAFTPDTLHLSVSGLGHWKILPVVFSASLDGTFLGPDCPAEAKRIRQR